MKKQGYTLAEALIALTIVGIVSAILLPISTKFAPDTDKITYLKTYDSMVQIIEKAMNNPSIYPIIGNNLNYQNFPLANTTLVQVDGVNFGNGVGNNKFCQVLSYGFNGGNTNCMIPLLQPPGFWMNNFTTPQGISFFVRTINTNPGQQQIYRSEVEFDINGVNEGGNCTYNANNCPNPDRFQFFITASGEVIPRDIMGQYYIATRHSYRKNNDADLAPYREVNVGDIDFTIDPAMID